MYHPVDTARIARRHTDALPRANPEEAARRALERVRKALTAYRIGMPLNAAALRQALACPLPQPEAEAERLFAIGWLHWLDGSFSDTERTLIEAVAMIRERDIADRLVDTAYWLARVQILLERSEAVADFETVLRQLGGSPQATVLFVDLLWRSGNIERAEQIWKALRSNKRLTALPEATLIEVHSLLRRGEPGTAVKLLVAFQPANGVAMAERLLLLAWAEAVQGQRARATELLKRTNGLPYPHSALEYWRGVIEQSVPRPNFVPFCLRELQRGYQMLAENRRDEARQILRLATENPIARPFARYALARHGADELAEVLSAQPGLFLAVRCRVWLALERFRNRAMTPAEWLESLQRESRLGFVAGQEAEHFRRLAEILRRPPSVTELAECVQEQVSADPAARRNGLRAAIEAAWRLPLVDVKGLFDAWRELPWLNPSEELGVLLAGQSLRLALLEQDGEAETQLKQDPALGPALELLRALQTANRDADWRQRLRQLQAHSRLRPLVQALLLLDAAQRRDVPGVIALLNDRDAWRGFRAGPPRFVLRAVESIVSAQPGLPGWRQTLPRWLGLWDRAALGEAEGLLAFAELTTAPASESKIPAAIAPAPWLLYQAARALERDDALEALACVRRALAIDPESAIAQQALPDLERRASAQLLATTLRCEDSAPLPAHLLTDIVDLLKDDPDGRAILDALHQGQTAAVREALDDLVKSPAAAPRLLHHLALIEERIARALEEKSRYQDAALCWRRSWSAWLRCLAAEGYVAVDARRVLLDDLLAHHRRRVNELLASSAIDSARQHWNLVQELPSLAAEVAPSLHAELAERVRCFRDELASEYLVTTRENMRYGAISDGWRADYEKGLSHLRRLLSLDRDNVRLLTALVETCGDWFLDLYNTGDSSRLASQVERFLPFALQLNRLTQTNGADLAVRSALSEYYKFRGFVAGDRAEKAALYREALRLNSANDNARELLAALGEKVDVPDSGDAP